MMKFLLDSYDKTNKFLKKYVIMNNELYRICGDHLGCGPLDGACFEFARALRAFVPRSKIYTIVDDFYNMEHHFVLGVSFTERSSPNTSYIDADGISTEDELLKRWGEQERLKDPRLELYGELIYNNREHPDPGQVLTNKLFSYFYKCLKLPI